MVDNIENIVLEHLKALRNEVKSLRTEMHEEFKDVKLRLHSIEGALVKVRSDNLGTQEDVYRQQASIDRLAERVERIERRLELT